MNRIICFLLTALSAHALCAQTESALNEALENRMDYLYCDFNEGIPTDFSAYDRDGKTLHFSMTQAGVKKDEAWSKVREERTTPANYYAGSGSKFKYADGEEKAAADDWLVTPEVWVRGNGAKLIWDGRSFGEGKKTSSYKVYVSTKGNKPEDFTDAPLLTVEDEGTAQWTKREVSLEQFKGQRIYVAFVNCSFDKEILGIDNLTIEGEKGLCELTTNYDRYISDVETVTVSATLTAFSDEVINSFTAYYEHNGKTFSKEVSGIALKKNESYTFTFDEKIPATVGDTINYKIWAEVNGLMSDVLECTVIPFLFIPKRKVVVEEGTAMWCVYCPKGIVAMEELAKKYPENFIGIAVHYDDVLELEGYRIDLAFPGFPSARINRKYLSEDIMKLVNIDGREAYSMLHGGIESLFLEAMADMTPAELDLKAATANGKIHATVNTRFAVSMDNARYQIAIVVIENDVTGPNFYQDNGFAGSSIPMGGYESMPDRIIGPTYQEVARAVYDDYKGIPGSVPAKIVAGENNVFEFSAAIPDNINSIENVQVIAMLVDQVTGEILNADITKPSPTGISGLLADNVPELSYGFEGATCIVNFRSASSEPAVLSLYTVGGVRLFSTMLQGGEASCPIATEGRQGVHFITVAQGGKTSTLKVIF